METVENSVHNRSMRIGIGPKEHHHVLRQALDCDRVFTLEQLDAMIEVEIESPLRPDDEDVAVLIRPSYLTPQHYKWLAGTKAQFVVPGHEPRKLITWDDRQNFRSLKPSADLARQAETRGAPKEYEIPDSYHPTAVSLWHDGEVVSGRWKPTYKPSEIVEKIKADTGVEVSKVWARDRAYEAVGHYRRNPNDAKERQTDD